ncbi:hypothetical protein JCM8097_008865 [Rhodosporidiobolus ruineniae]
MVRKAQAADLDLGQASSDELSDPGLGGFEQYFVDDVNPPPQRVLVPPVVPDAPHIARAREALQGERTSGARWTLEDNLEEAAGTSSDEGSEEELDECELDDFVASVRRGMKAGDFFPFSSPAAAMIFLVAHYPASHLSRPAVQLLIAALQILDVAGVPSYHSYRKQVEAVRESAPGGDPVQHRGSSGHVFSYKNIAGGIQQDLLNPRLASELDVFPRVHSGLSDCRDGDYYRHLDPSLLTPMYRDNLSKDWYIDEPVCLTDGRYFLLMRFVNSGAGGMLAEGVILERDGDKVIITSAEEEIPVRKFMRSGSAQRELATLTLISKTGNILPLVNPLRAQASGRRVISVIIMPWQDGLSGVGKIKQALHTAVEYLNLSLWTKVRDESCRTKLLSISQKAKVLQMTAPMVEEIKKIATTPTVMWNAHPKEETLVFIRPLNLCADIPAFSEWSCSMGHNANVPCRNCDTVKPKKITDAQDLYNYLQSGHPRDVDETVKTLHMQLKLASENKKPAQEALRSSSGIACRLVDEVCETLYEAGDAVWREVTDEVLAKKPTKKRRKEAEDRDEIEERVEVVMKGKLEEQLAVGAMNPLLELRLPPLGLNIHRLTPPDPLHSLPLGPTKELATFTSKRLNPQRRYELQVRLASVEKSGLGGAEVNLDYLVDHMSALQGKEVAALAKRLPTVLPTMCDGQSITPELVEGWRAAGELMRLVSMRRVEEYDVQSYFVPNFSISRFEAFNSTLRMFLGHTNRQAPSKDIVAHAQLFEQTKHILEGGEFGKGAEKGKGRTAGAGLLKMVSETRVLREAFHLPEKGRVSSTPNLLNPDTKSPLLAFPDPLLSRLSLFATPSTTLFSSVEIAEDKIKREDFAVIELRDGSDAKFGWEDGHGSESFTGILRVNAFAKPSSSSPSFLFGGFVFGSRVVIGSQSDDYDMPVLTVTKEVGIFPLEALKCAVSVHYDCCIANCGYDGQGAEEVDERRPTGLTKPTVNHDFSSPHYILNTCATRSAHLLQALHPRIEALATLEDVVRQASGENDFHTG